MDALRIILGSPEFTTLILGAFTSIVAIIAGRLAQQARLSLAGHLSASDFSLLRSIAVTAVQFAEQKFAEAGGPVKLEQALAAADVQISAYGLTVTAEQLLHIIEAAVYAETNKPVFPAVVPPTT